ncbi:triose-phosphate transporter family-domain-containing protein [Aspergillus flavus]|uniref:Triose-phosphate transporter family-domain-containing protein n=1 Tax=Aspergillus flavus (strain ATCC 200026 / FGSC A1120 / IAM 13836 / NRRL 3357 / JCM 12722 / SRRC 167) TaxID=332952 RepID=A0A7U2QYE3_ASPFN|nr:triose-phosphate transporter family-domain-containing protein [Aspergillus flavus]
MSKPFSLWQQWQTAIRVVVWLSLSICVVLSNKWLVDDMGFAYPPFLATCHMLFGALVSSFLQSCTSLPARKPTSIGTPQYLSLITPLAFFFIMSIVCGNEAMAHISITMIQILKGMSPVIVYVITLCFGMSKFNVQRAVALLMVSLGVFVASSKSLRTSSYGIFIQLMGVGADSLRLALMQRILTAHDESFDPAALFHHLAPFCAFLGAVNTLFTTVPTVADLARVWKILLFSCTLTSALNISTLSLIKGTSSVYLSACGVIKDISLMAASSIIWRTKLDVREAVGYGAAFFGLIMYHHLSHQSRI